MDLGKYTNYMCMKRKYTGRLVKASMVLEQRKHHIYNYTTLWSFNFANLAQWFCGSARGLAEVGLTTQLVILEGLRSTKYTE